MEKKQLRLAILGDVPTFDQPLYVGRPNVGDRERLLSRINDMLDRRWLSNNGPFVQEFEKKIADFSNVKHAICVCNATIGLEIAIRALDLKGEVIVPANTFVATAHALQWQEITPVFADIDPETQNLDPIQVERQITPRTTGILATHVWGRPCDIDALQELANRKRLKLIFDAAHAFGCSYRGRMIGGFGLAEVFSFHATKFLNSFEGGAVCTNDDVLAKRVRLMTNFGFSGFDNVIHIGTNGKMTEVAAAMGLTSLESIDQVIATNHRNWLQYTTELKDIPGVKVISYNESEKCNFQYIMLEVESLENGLNRDWILEVLHAENILARRYFYPGVHRMEPYRSHFPHARMLLPETERLMNKLLILPSGTAVTPIEISKVCNIIRLCRNLDPEEIQKVKSAPRRVTPDLR